MSDEIKLPRWFLLIKKVCQELLMGLLSTCAFLYSNAFNVKDTLSWLYQPIMLVLLAGLIFCGVFSCQDWINKFKKK